MKNWYVVKVNVSKEKQAIKDIKRILETKGMQDKVSQIIAPFEERIQTKKLLKLGKEKSIKELMLYKGYIFVEMDLDHETYWTIRNAPNVKGFLGGTKPVPLTQDEIKNLMGVMEEIKSRKTPKPDIVYKKDEGVRIVSGPFRHFQGIIEEVNEEKGKLKVSVFLFGRPTSVELNFTEVEKL